MASDNAQPRRIRTGRPRHPLAVVLSAPVRFVADRLRFRGGHPGPDTGPDPSGDREPRRPRPNPPDDSVALSEPRA